MTDNITLRGEYLVIIFSRNGLATGSDAHLRACMLVHLCTCIDFSRFFTRSPCIHSSVRRVHKLESFRFACISVGLLFAYTRLKLQRFEKPDCVSTIYMDAIVIARLYPCARVRVSIVICKSLSLILAC